MNCAACGIALPELSEAVIITPGAYECLECYERRGGTCSAQDRLNDGLRGIDPPYIDPMWAWKQRMPDD